tara:strand:+ start:490 stop:1842 length:1353 start_codon:yes stop_codon:yes gene_type:complete
MGNRTTKILSESSPVPLKRGKSLSFDTLRGKNKNERLNIIKRRMSSQARQPRTCFEPSGMNKKINPMDDLLLGMQKMKVHVPITPEYLCNGTCHNQKTLPFEGFEPGIVMDLETCYSGKRQPVLAHSYIQQIGACGIGNDKGDFNICCLLPEVNVNSFKLETLPEPSTSVEMFKKVLGVLNQQVDASFNGYIKVTNSSNCEKFLEAYKHSKLYWRENKISRNVPPLEEIQNHKNAFKHGTLLFKLDDALSLFMDYCGPKPVWYAHNGYRFDFPIMEKWFKIYGMDWFMSPAAYGRKTTAMSAYRNRTVWDKYTVLNMNGKSLTGIRWLKTNYPIKCYDTFYEIPKSKYSRYYGKKGALRETQRLEGWDGKGDEPQGTKQIVSTKLDGSDAKEKWIWPNGDVTASKYGFKLQDLLIDNNIRGNDKSAHTALADCWTLRELIYRVFGNKIKV